jgi:hypothetical protein
VNAQAMGVVVVFAALVFYFWPSEERWTAIVYPDASDLGPFVNLGDFSSLESCGAASRGYIRGLELEFDSDYECGLNCEMLNLELGLMICERTER